MYLHDMADTDISFTKEDMHAGKHADYEKRLMDTLLKTAAPPIPVPQSIIPPQPLISSTLSNTLAAAAAKLVNPSFKLRVFYSLLFNIIAKT